MPNGRFLAQIPGTRNRIGDSAGSDRPDRPDLFALFPGVLTSPSQKVALNFSQNYHHFYAHKYFSPSLKYVETEKKK